MADAAKESTRDLESLNADDLPFFAEKSARQVVGRVVCTNFTYFMAGLNGEQDLVSVREANDQADASTGVLIPYIQPAYGIGLLQISFAYLINFTGWLFASFTNIHVCSRLGTDGTLVVGAAVQSLGYALMFWKPPFPLFLAALFFTGMGVAFQDAQSNTFTITVKNSHRWLGLLHAVYGVGTVVCPLIANTIAARTPYWHFYYPMTFGLGLCNTSLLAWSFRRGLFRPNVVGAKHSANTELKATLTSKTVWILNSFFFLYVGAEVTAGGTHSDITYLPILILTNPGWLVQFLVSVRHGQPSKVGYIASGFWSGFTLGRVLLADITHKLGERRMVFVYIALAISMQLIFWFTPDIIVNAIAVCFLGMYCMSSK